MASCDLCIKGAEKLEKLWFKYADAGDLAGMKALREEFGKCYRGFNQLTGQACTWIEPRALAAHRASRAHMCAATFARKRSTARGSTDTWRWRTG